jgi:septum formation protein
VTFRVVASGEAEDTDAGLPAAERVMAHARGKAHDVAARTGVPAGGAVLGADTEVVLHDRTLGKAADRGAAETMLRSLSGRAHTVMTGVVLITAGGEQEHLSAAQVRFRPLDDATIRWYLGMGEWQGRAGAYAIQGAGAALVAGITGDPSTVIGLPVGDVAHMLREAGLLD